MDRRHGKRPLPFDASEEKKEDEVIFPGSTDPRQDERSSASAATSGDHRQPHGQGGQITSSQPTQDQGKQLVHDMIILLTILEYRIIC